MAAGLAASLAFIGATPDDLGGHRGDFVVAGGDVPALHRDDGDAQQGGGDIAVSRSAGDGDDDLCHGVLFRQAQVQSATLAALEAHRGVGDEDLDKLAVTGLGIEERNPSAVVVRSAAEDVRHLAGEARAGIQLTGGGAATAAE